jgi:1-acyl-sn-glycerol-3-phosphate acyltransferase
MAAGILPGLLVPLIRAAAVVFVMVGFFLAAAPLRRMPRRIDLGVLFCRCLLALLRVDVVRHGTTVPGGCLLVSNHVSWVDILVYGSLGPASFLAKREVASWPLVSSFARLQQTVFVDRARRRSIPPANAAMAMRMRAGRPVILFPEGTTLDGTALGRFHSSHFGALRDLLAQAHEQEDAIVQPVAIAYSAPHMAWIGDATLLPHLWAILCGAPTRCEVIFATPIRVPRGADRKQVALASATAIAAELAALRPEAAVRPQSMAYDRVHFRPST